MGAGPAPGEPAGNLLTLHDVFPRSYYDLQPCRNFPKGTRDAELKAKIARTVLPSPSETSFTDFFGSWQAKQKSWQCGLDLQQIDKDVKAASATLDPDHQVLKRLSRLGHRTLREETDYQRFATQTFWCCSVERSSGFPEACSQNTLEADRLKRFCANEFKTAVLPELEAQFRALRLVLIRMSEARPIQGRAPERLRHDVSFLARNTANTFWHSKKISLDPPTKDEVNLAFANEGDPQTTGAAQIRDKYLQLVRDNDPKSLHSFFLSRSPILARFSGREITPAELERALAEVLEMQKDFTSSAEYKSFLSAHIATQVGYVAKAISELPENDRPRACELADFYLRSRMTQTATLKQVVAGAALVGAVAAATRGAGTAGVKEIAKAALTTTSHGAGIATGMWTLMDYSKALQVERYCHVTTLAPHFSDNQALCNQAQADEIMSEVQGNAVMSAGLFGVPKAAKVLRQGYSKFRGRSSSAETSPRND